MQFRIVIIIILYFFYVIFYKISGENLAKIGKKKKKKNWTTSQQIGHITRNICYLGNWQLLFAIDILNFSLHIYEFYHSFIVNYQR